MREPVAGDGDSFDDPAWFLWPVTFAFFAGIAAGRLWRRGSRGSALVAVASLALPVVPLTFALPVHCGDDTAGIDLNPIPLGVGLLGIVAWLAVVYRLRVNAGDDGPKAERSVLWTAAALVPLGFIELIPSALTLADYCVAGDHTAQLAHLAVAGVVFFLTLAGTASDPPSGRRTVLDGRSTRRSSCL